MTKFDSNASFGLSEIVRLGPSFSFTDSPRFTGTLPSLAPGSTHTFPFTPPPIDYIGGAYMGIADDLHAPYSFNLNASFGGLFDVVDAAHVATINAPGPNDNVPDTAESNARRPANVAWLNAAFDQAHATNAAGVMIVW